MYSRKYVLRRSLSNRYQYYWNLYAVNGEIILTSENYDSEQGARDGIASSKRNVADTNFDRRTASSYPTQYYFVQVASGNYKTIGKSEMYNSAQARDNGISAVKRDAPLADIVDLT